MWYLILGIAFPTIWNLLLVSILFKHYIKEYFPEKLGNVQADIYSYTSVDTKTKFATF